MSHRHLPAEVIAARRAQSLDNPMDRHRFANAFHLGQRYAATGRSSYIEFRRAIEADDSVTVAGLIEGQSSVPRRGNITLAEAQTYQSFPATVVKQRRSRKAGRLTEGQREYLIDAARGLTAAESARKRCVAEYTVKTMLAHARKRLGALNTTHAVTLALLTEQIAADDIENTDDRKEAF